MRINPTLFYWKWSEASIRNERLEKNLKNMTDRFSFDLLYVSVHHMKNSLADPELLEKIDFCQRYLSAQGKKLLLDMDIRREIKGFQADYPEIGTYMVRFVEFDLDENGKGEVFLPNIVRTAREGSETDKDQDVLLKAWTFIPGRHKSYLPETLAEITHKAQMINVRDEKGEGWISRFSVDGGKDGAGKRAILFPAYRYNLPDPFSEAFYQYYDSLFSHVDHMPLGGAAVDEYGFTAVIEQEDKNFFLRHFPYTPLFSKAYALKSGTYLEEDLLHLAYGPQGNEGVSYRTVNLYLQTLRDVMRENNDWFYYKTKEVFGKDAFVGVHPTLWGDPTDFTLDILLNGLDWWEVRRDYAQTDECVAMPVRLALAHKWGGSVWYNMWYSQGTLLMDTYFSDTWNSARYGGRTHYLGYECPDEGGVLDLKHPGMLEELEAMENRIGLLDRVQLSQPDSRVLILFGMEGVTNWRLNGQDDGVIVRMRGNLRKVAKFALSLFNSGYLCDMAPTTEISGGSIHLENRKLRYGTQDYDAVLFLCPECADPVVLDFLKDYCETGGKLAVSGGCKYLNDGTSAEDSFSVLKAKVDAVYGDIPETLTAIGLLRQWEIAGNMPPGGCVYQDGSVVFTATGILPSGNPIYVDCDVKGHRITFEGEDFLYLDMDEDGRVKRWLSGKGQDLRVDGSPLLF